MPPQRTNSLPRTIPPAKPASKPVKSERTHEENQERAYIAASRRSDRSLEARVESARRASEIHKRRTGRALRVTEADVINEEMYEEEDDDTTHAYRNLGMLMGTGHQIDRRFHAYYAHQMQMKGIVDQMIQQQAQMQHGRAAMAGGVYGQNPMYSGGYIPQQQQQQLYPFFRQQVPQMAPSYRASPYSVPHSHGRAMSMHIPQNQSMRVPQPGVGISLQNKSPGLISPVSPALDSSSDHVRHMSAPPPNPATPSMKPRYTGGHTSPSHPHQLPSPASDDDGSFDSLFPLTNELPGESARFLQGASETDLNMPYNFDLFDNTMYTTSKGFTTSLSPLQQNSPFSVKTEDGLAKNNPFHVKTEDGLAKNNPFYVKTEDGLAKNNPFFVKTEDGLATTTGELKWQPSKLDSSFPNNANLNGSLLAETINPDDDILSSLFMMPSTPNNFTALGDCSSVGTLSTDDIVDNEAWDSFMNQEWLDAGTVN